MSSQAPVPTLAGRTLVGVSNTGDGEVDGATTFTYHELDGLIGLVPAKASLRSRGVLASIWVAVLEWRHDPDDVQSDQPGHQ